MARLTRRGGYNRLRGFGIYTLTILALTVLTALPSMARTPAEMVMDARTGEILHAKNPDVRVHPASLTKMMTLYIAFEAVEHGEIGLDDYVTVTANAAAEPPSKLYLKAGQKIQLRYLIRAAAVKSANDAATAIGEAISGSESAFADRMTRTARAMGMSNTTFKNANGLTQTGHMSTARDLSILGRHMLYDYPDYYNIFSRLSADAGIKTVANTNRRLLTEYTGADGIKTGYTDAAGSNLVASAERGGVRIITTVLGANSSAARNARVKDLLSLGFNKAPRSAAIRAPGKPAYVGGSGAAMAANDFGVPTVRNSAIPRARPAYIVAMASGQAVPEAAAQAQATAIASILDDLANNTETVIEDTTEEGIDDAIADASEVTPDALDTPVSNPTIASAVETVIRPLPRPSAAAAPADVAIAALTPEAEDDMATLALTASDATAGQDTDLVTMRRGVEEVLSDLVTEPEQVTPAPLPQETITALTPPAAMVIEPTPAPQARPSRVTYSTSNMALPVMDGSDAAPVVVSTSPTVSGTWGVRVGRFTNRWEAERVMLRTMLQQPDILGKTERSVVSRSSAYQIQFKGLSETGATLACKRLSATEDHCDPFKS